MILIACTTDNCVLSDVSFQHIWYIHRLYIECYFCIDKLECALCAQHEFDNVDVFTYLQQVLWVRVCKIWYHCSLLSLVTSIYVVVSSLNCVQDEIGSAKHGELVAQFTKVEVSVLLKRGKVGKMQNVLFMRIWINTYEIFSFNFMWTLGKTAQKYLIFRWIQFSLGGHECLKVHL